MTTPRIAVVGAGYWGKKVIREILDISRSTGKVSIHAIADNSPTMLTQCQQEFGPLDYRVNYQELLNDPELSAVHICTPNATHYEVASSFIRKGKHVLVEKPLALKSTEAFELVRLARENNVILCTGHVHRFSNGVRQLRQILTNGILGELFYLRFRWTGLLVPQLQREVITDLAPHPFDICNYLSGKWPSKVTCWGRGYRTKDNEEVAFITAEHDGGLTAHVEVSWLDREKRRDVTVVGGNGMAHLDCSEQRLVLHGVNGPEQIQVTPSNTLRSEILHFIDCINHNPHALPSLSDGLVGANVVSVLEAARQSLAEERTVQVHFPIAEEIPAK